MEILTLVRNIGLASLIVCTGCDQVKEATGIKKTAPDSFTVHPRAQGLEVPPHLSVIPSPETRATLSPLSNSEKEILSRIQLSP